MKSKIAKCVQNNKGIKNIYIIMILNTNKIAVKVLLIKKINL